MIFDLIITFSGDLTPEIMQIQENLHFSLSKKLGFYSLNCREKPKNLNVHLKVKEKKSELGEGVLKDLLHFYPKFRNSEFI